jgi:hypothetical protein
LGWTFPQSRQTKLVFVFAIGAASVGVHGEATAAAGGKAARRGGEIPYTVHMHVVRGLWNLALLGAKTGFRLKGRYWTWRMETAFGADRSKWPSAAERRRAAIEYGAWVGAMRRMARDRG